MDNEVKIRISIDDNGSQTLKTIGVNAEDLSKLIKDVKDNIDDLNPSVVNFAQMAQSIDAVTGVFGQLKDAVGELSGYYAAQTEAETKLETAMRNTMGATEEDIKAIKDLCSAQQELGVIGDEVQISGAQELATYLEKRESLEALIPVMNDMMAQQYGLNATQESAAQIASMLGKVMDGQTSALSRYGYSFTEAQEEILKFGSESERAAVLAEVVGQSVGGMNAALAQTDAGKQKQLENTLGDIKEQLGQVAVKIQPFVTALATIGDAAGGIKKVYDATKALSAAQTIASVKTLALAGHQRVQAVAQKLLAASGYTAAAGTTALTAATTALYAALTLGISAVIMAIVGALGMLNDETEKYVETADAARDATRAFDSTMEESSSQLQMEIARLKGLKDGTESAAKKVDELNSRYGEAFGYHKTAAEWYDVLVSKSQAYCQQLGYEAQAKVLAAQKAAKELEFYANGQKMNELLDNGGTTSSSAYQALVKQNGELLKDIKTLGNQFDTCMEKARDAAAEMDSVTVGAIKKTNPTSTEATTDRESYEAGTLGEIEERIRSLQQQRKHATAETIAGINDEIAKLEEEKKALEDATNVLSLPEITVTLPSLSYAEGTLGALQQQLEKLEKMRLSALGEDLEEINQQISDLQKKSAELRGETLTPKIEATPMQKYRQVVQQVTAAHEAAMESMRGIGSTMDSLGQAVGGAAGEWLTWGGNLLNAIASAIPQLMALTTAQTTEATANTAAAATGAASSVASIPYVGPVLAVAAVASVLASLANLPKFANGGIAYGPTLGLFGEYAGASGNPEVVAPLNKLRDILGIDARGGQELSGVRFEMRQRGRDLVGVGEKVMRVRERL